MMWDKPPLPELTKRPLPDFQRWLDERGHTSRADDFEAFADLARRTQEQSAKGFGAEAEAFLRLWQGLSIAVVELCNIERTHGTPPEVIISIMPRALGCAAFYSAASIFGNDTPWRQVARVLIEEFRFAAKQSADQHGERLDRENADGKP